MQQRITRRNPSLLPPRKNWCALKA